MDSLKAYYGMEPGNLTVYIGLSICADCFETGPEVPAAFEAALGSAALDCVRPGTDDLSHAAVVYMRNQRKYLERYLEDGRMEVCKASPCFDGGLFCSLVFDAYQY